MQDGGRWMVVALFTVLAFVAIGNFVAGLFGVEINWLASLGTAVVVGGVLALIFLRPRKPKAKGFTVDSVEK